MKALSLFSGIGGLDYGFDLAGIETVLQVESDAWCRAVLEHHWPEVPRIDDVCKIDAATLAGRGGDVARAGRESDPERPRHAGGRRGDAISLGDRRADGGQPEPARRGAADGVLAPDHDQRGEAGRGLPSGIDLVHGGFPCQDVSV